MNSRRKWLSFIGSVGGLMLSPQVMAYDSNDYYCYKMPAYPYRECSPNPQDEFPYDQQYYYGNGQVNFPYNSPYPAGNFPYNNYPYNYPNYNYYGNEYNNVTNNYYNQELEDEKENSLNEREEHFPDTLPESPE